MTKFEIGDRVKATRSENASGDAIEKGRIYTVGSLDDVGDPVLETDHEHPDIGWSDSFELYAKAGEFVAGETVVGIEDVAGLRRGDLCKVMEILPQAAVGTVQVLLAARVSDGKLLQLWAARFRLATPEEIATAEGKPTPLAMELMQKLRDNDAKTATEILAAEFDFSTIKVGDVVSIRYTVDRDGFKGGLFSVETEDGVRWCDPKHVHSVIPAPKPKTLRERAIEAVCDSSPADHNLNIETIVDLVLAEVKKGQ